MSLSLVDRVGEIFSFAGQAFTKLSELTVQFENSEDSSSEQKWDEEDIEKLKSAIQNFSEDLQRLSENVKTKTINQMKQGLKRKVQVTKGLSQLASTSNKRIAKTNHSATPTTPATSATPATPAIPAAATTMAAKSVSTPIASTITVTPVAATPAPTLIANQTVTSLPILTASATITAPSLNNEVVTNVITTPMPDLTSSFIGSVSDEIAS